MAIAKNRKRTRAAISERRERLSLPERTRLMGRNQNKKLTMIRIDPELLTHIDRAQKRLGISRGVFIVSSTAKELERMEA